MGRKKKNSVAQKWTAEQGVCHVEAPPAQIFMESCDHCGRKSDNLLCCSSCKGVVYCNRDCQVAAWPGHKEDCKRFKKAKARSKENKHKNMHALFMEWRLQILSRNKLGLFIGSQFTPHELLNIDEGSALLVRVKLNYNYRTFLPTSKPVITPINSGKASLDAELRKAAARAKSLTTSDEAHFIIVLYEEEINTMVGLNFSTEFPDRIFEQLNLEESLFFFYDVILSSSKIHSLVETHCKPNMKAQIRGGLFRMKEWECFFRAVLRIDSFESRHLSHVIEIDMKMGFGVGEIERVNSFKVIPVSEAISMAPSGIQASLEDNELNLQNSPCLRQAQRNNPNCVLIPTVFTDRKAGMLFVDSEIFPVDPEERSAISAHLLDEKARNAFSQIQENVTFPAVESPGLH